MTAAPVTLVQAQLEAYNAHDIEAFARCFAEDVHGWRLGEAEPFLRSRADLVARYGPLFAERQALHARVVHRVVYATFVTDEEEVEGLDPDGGLVRATAIYEVDATHIRRVWFVR